MRLEKSAFKHYSSRLSPQAAPLLIENQLKKRNKERGCVVGGANQPTNQLSKKAHRHAVSVCDDQTDSSRSIVPAAAAALTENAHRGTILHMQTTAAVLAPLSLFTHSHLASCHAECVENSDRERERDHLRVVSPSGLGRVLVRCCCCCCDDRLLVLTLQTAWRLKST
jgi:hypothetical protein